MIGQKNYLGELIIDDNATFTIDSFSFYQGCCLNVSANAKFSALSGFINSYSKITCTNLITVGEDVFIGNNVTIIDTDFHTISGSIKSAPINIGNHVWIGSNATVLKGVTIGDGAVVSAGSIVTHDVPPRALVAGIPAKVIRENVDWNH